MEKEKSQKLTFPACIFDFSKSVDEKYEIMKKNSDANSQARLIAMTKAGSFEYAAMKAASEFISEMISVANEKNDAQACKFIINYINAFMLAFSKDTRNAFYREVMSRFDMFDYTDEASPFLWRIIPDFAVRHLLDKPADASKCECFNLFKGYHWCALLSEKPEFEKLADKYDGFRKMIYYHEEQNDGSWHIGYTEVMSYWSNLLKAQPSFKDKCKQYNGFADFCSESPDPLPTESLNCLVNGENRRIQLIGYDDFELDEHRKGENGWVELLKSTKEFDTEFEEYKAYYSLNEEDWKNLLATRPELGKFKPAERNLEIYPCFDFDDSDKCENDQWNECDVGGIEKAYIIVNLKKIRELWDKVSELNELNGK